jgi:hypothetical protein
MGSLSFFPPQPYVNNTNMQWEKKLRISFFAQCYYLFLANTLTRVPAKPLVSR